MWRSGEAIWLPEVVEDGLQSPRSEAARRAGITASALVPAGEAGTVSGVLEALALTSRERDPAVLAALVAAAEPLGALMREHAERQSRRWRL